MLTSLLPCHFLNNPVFPQRFAVLSPLCAKFISILRSVSGDFYSAHLICLPLPALVLHLFLIIEAL